MKKYLLQNIINIIYIKSNTISLINSNIEIDCFGTIPIFEHLRRCNVDGISLCCLTGTICIIPKNCCDYLSDEFEYKEINNSNYISLKINNKAIRNMKQSQTKVTNIIIYI